ncbi:MAG: hypothetical protein GOMPHAMPRED_001409 [Gomphillus americanus]|uniref:Uncharacterized protein n=1 Tax=Gomphillus americanus TaxID=1940652 RepID=A0A8H3IGL7_9LECA|nr:MAG: hypothetical protein GOMPHAMPRED_001409 [Gomphillus americanus]
MADTPDDEMRRSCLEDTIIELRTSRMKKMPGLQIKSGIDKQIVSTPIRLSKLGLTDDEHDLVFHGGPDKAVLGYCVSHYPSWQASFPDRASRFVAGGFGENFVLSEMNERNVCIGDIVSVGSQAILQVSLPRQPCFKLNHRFSLKNFAPKTYQSSRTGWYYRVLQEGTIKAGDKVKVVQRHWPDWPIERIQEYLHRNTENLAMNTALAAIEDLGKESREQFQNRVDKANKAREKENLVWLDFRVTARSMETPRIVKLTLEAVKLDPEARSITSGSHVSIKLPNGLVRSYSVVSSKSGNDFELGIALTNASRGGSKHIHGSVHVGTILPVMITRRTFPNAPAASNHCFVVGGIGLTAFLALMEKMRAINFNFTMHYAVRSTQDVPFTSRLDKLAEHVIVYDKSKGQTMDVRLIMSSLPWNSHVYVCGPPRMMDNAQAAAQEVGLTDEEVHYEAFQADVGGDPFEAKVLNRDGKVVQISGTDSLLQVLRREFGDDVASSCEVGNCGTCKVKVNCGRIEHKGTALSSEDKKDHMLSCISRGIGQIEIEI